MMKNVFFPILLLLALMLPANALAYDFAVDGLYYTLNGNEVSVARSPSNSYSGDIVIPSSVTYNGTTYAVTGLDYRAFLYCPVTSVFIPNSVTSMGDMVFAMCSNMTSVRLPNSITAISNYAFYGCESLMEIVIPNSVTTIGNFAFVDCTSLTSVTIPNSLTEIGEVAFLRCSSLTSVAIPASVTTIGSSAFGDCDGLQRVDITDLAAWCQITYGNNTANPLNCGHYLYLNGTKITTLVIPSSVSAVSDCVFSGLYGVSTVYMPSSVTYIGDMSFNRCRDLVSVSLPNSLITIEQYAFYECESLQSIHIPASVSFIGLLAFCGTSAMTSMTVASGNTTYDSRNNCNAIIKTSTNTLIEGCKNTVIPNTVTAIDGLAFASRRGLTSITIPNSVTLIGNQAFSDCIALTSIHIPSSVNTIMLAVFQGCDALTRMTVASDNPYYDSRDNCNAIIQTQNNELVAGCQTTVIPNTVTKIGRYSFDNCRLLRSINIPNSVTVIDNEAFGYCDALTSVNIPNSVTKIGNWAFMHCYALSDVYSEIVNPAAIDMGNDVFSDYNDDSAFTGRTLHVPTGTRQAYQADTKWSEFFEFIVESGLNGDADGDGETTIADVSILIDYLLGNTAANINQANADLDGDGEVTIADVSDLIDLLLIQ